MHLYGLTGGIASGKSTVSATLAKRGCPIIDADVIARQGERAAMAGTNVGLIPGSLPTPKAPSFTDLIKGRRLQNSRSVFGNVHKLLLIKMVKSVTGSSENFQQLSA